ncbi:Outer membrane receptor proteins, mostly Fe transport [Solimonas aquatica]|uniref:Outer membrane receptor proteins, mostly Fe transport n=1 Tax=Solimonas aquatica TaxID=489703 RepID=A0A1H9APZ7_9GAMM|nr:TonB-dependent receptor [Solimonas aquatica]SEP78834.1 Outer membrane receptor proteins, mostly Fe transport [Solimonas aquatica]
MRNLCFTVTPWAAALSLALAAMASAHAQEAAEPPAATAPTADAATGPLDLDEVVVTASLAKASKMDSSVSVSTLDAEQILQSGASSTAELLRSIPGVRSESSGGESNANLTVRGVPISAGGSRYVQYQEDGLPILQFGDIAFATPDSFVRTDLYTSRLEVIRGGSASTLASNAPGGIINFISNRGEHPGGSAAISYGLDFEQTRYDLAYGGPAGDSNRFFVAGHYRSGEGMRNGGVGIEQGGQLRGNFTHDFENGSVTVSFKHLDDHSPTYLPVPVQFSSSGKISRRPGIDPRKASFYSPYWQLDATLARDNTRVLSDINDGLTAKTDAIGVDAQFDLGQGWSLSEKFSHASNSGRFIGIFPGDDPASVSTTYLTGPKAGQAYNGPAFHAVVFNTSLDDLGLTANDLKLEKSLNLGEATVKASAGIYTATQNLAVTWNFNQYLLEASGNKPAMLNDASNGTVAFGGCCSNTQDSQYRSTSPYAALSLNFGALNLDGSLRRDKQKATGSYNQLGFAGSGATQYDLSKARAIDYEVDHNSYSVGANYRLSNDLALFARYSDGVAFNADRITFFHAAAQVDGSSPVPVNEIKQTEAGVKWRHQDLSSFLTFFQAKTDESNFDVTTQKGSANRYDAKGVELELGYRLGGFSLGGGLTYTDAEVKDSTSPALIGKAPKRQARLVYQLTPSYAIGELMLGASLVGTGSAKDDGPAGALSVTLPSYLVVNAFASYQLVTNTELALSANNLFDTLGYTESNDGRQAARAIDGRSMKASLKYRF